MSGQVEGHKLGIVFFDHPKNLRHPTRWHARDYGLFAANPFCEHDMDKSQPPGTGQVTLAAGQSLVLRYRFYIHEGDAAQAKVAERYAEYIAEKDGISGGAGAAEQTAAPSPPPERPSPPPPATGEQPQQAPPQPPQARTPPPSPFRVTQPKPLDSE